MAALFETPDVPRVPHLMVGAASPLWGYFGGVALGGMAFWWMTRWTRPANLEAMFDAALRAMAPAEEPPPAPTLELSPAISVPTGGEAAPASPVPAAAPAPEPAPIPQPAPDPTPLAEPTGPRLRKGAPPPADA